VAKSDDVQRAGRAVAARRGELGLTQQELADDAGVDIKTVYNLESGQRWPISKNRAAIAVALRWEPDALTVIAGGSEPETRPSAVPAPPPPSADIDGAAPAFTRRGGIELPPEIRRGMGPHLDLIEARMLNAALAQARQRGVPLTAILGPDLDDPAWVPSGAEMFPAEPQERRWWDDLRAAGILGTPHTGAELADSVALLMWRRGRENSGENSGAASALARSALRRC
jgi:transcriptional regulator with XRE-family HTH domain